MIFLTPELVAAFQSQHSSQKAELSSMSAASSHYMTEDGGLYIKTRFLSHRDKTGKLWKLRELHETEWEVTEIWVRCVEESDLGFHVPPPDAPEVRPPPDVPEVRPPPDVPEVRPAPEEPPVLPCSLNSITEPPVTVGAAAGSSSRQLRLQMFQQSASAPREPRTIISELNRSTWSADGNEWSHTKCKIWYTRWYKAWKLVQVHRDDNEVIEVWARFHAFDVRGPGWLLIQSFPMDDDGAQIEYWARDLGVAVHPNPHGVTQPCHQRGYKRRRTS